MGKLFLGTDKSNHKFSIDKPVLRLSHYKILKVVAFINKKAKKELVRFGVKEDYNVTKTRTCFSKAKDKVCS